MKSSLSKRALRSALALGTLAGVLVAAAGPAHAADPPVPVPITLGGADATLQVLDGIFKDVPNIYNLPTQPTPPGYLVPAKAHAPETNWVKGIASEGGVWNFTTTPYSRNAPNGAGAGLDILKQQETDPVDRNGGLDIARSSSAPRGLSRDAAGFEYYAFALDAVSWASPSLSAPASITKDQLIQIYNCEITDWSQLPGGGSGPIRRYEAHNTTHTDTSAGTWSFFRSDLLNNIIPPDGVDGTACPTVGHTEQSTATFVHTPGQPSSPANLGLEPEDYQKAIVIYTSGVWAYQANNAINPTLDKRNGARLGGVNGQNTVSWDADSKIFALNTEGPVKEGNVKVNSANPGTVYPGIRYQYLVIDNHPVNVNYDLSRSLVGFDNIVLPDPGTGRLNQPTSVVSELCNGGKVSPILSYGFAPLDRSDPSIGVNAGANKAHSTCRLFINHS